MSQKNNSQKKISLEQVYQLAYDCMKANDCNHDNADALAETMTAAERDMCHAHGLFRLPGYAAALKSGKVKGDAAPTIKKIAPAVLQLDAHNGYAPLALKAAKDALAECASENGIAAMALIRIHHFAALWMEIEALAEMGLAAFAFTAYKLAVAPAGGSKPFFGTNPMAFGWPRKNQLPMVFDQASAAMARGEVMIAARDGKILPDGVGITKDGQPTTDPNQVLEGAMLTFGGHKGASIALMIELLVGPLIGEAASFEAGKADNNDGGPPQGGELIIAIDPGRFGSSEDPYAHAERLFEELLSQKGTRLPAQRRYDNRKKTPLEGVSIPESLLDTIKELTGYH